MSKAKSSPVREEAQSPPFAATAPGGEEAQPGAPPSPRSQGRPEKAEAERPDALEKTAKDLAGALPGALAAQMNGQQSALASQIEDLGKALRSGLTDLHKILADRFGGHDGQLAGLLEEIKRAQVEKRVLTEMHDRCRALTEQQHEREVLGPIFQAVISVLDRLYQENAKTKRLLDQHVDSQDWQATTHLGQVLEARKADEAELTNVLANFSVEPFRHPGDRVDASHQKAIQVVKTPDPGLHGHIARRLRPGYRRNGTILRRELVSVYVKEDQKGKTKGD